jgi:hypothetical protein
MESLDTGLYSNEYWGFGMGIDAYYIRMKEDALRKLTSDDERLKALPSDGAQEDGEELSAFAQRMLVLENYWDSLHFLLTGSKFPTSPAEETGNILSVALVGGTPVGPPLVHGPARYLTPAQVRKIASALEPLEFEELVSNCAPEDFEAAELYKVTDFEEEIEALEEYFPYFKAFFENAAGANEAVLSYMT